MDGEEFWQGEILSGVIEYRWRGPDDEATIIGHPLAIIFSADCDLTQHFKAISAGNPTADKLLPNVLLCDVMHSEQLREASKAILTSKLWADVRKNKSERYQFLAELTADRDLQGAGLPTLAINFKQYFCVSHEHLLKQLSGDAKRRCRLAYPFAQHAAQRFFYAQARIGLPVDHDV
jgi:hypothetical protein